MDGHTRASDILRGRRGVLATLAKRLMDQEVVEGAEVRSLIGQVPSSAPEAA
jgi:ATP-dependent Zn protease